VVGCSGYAVNLAVYALLTTALRLQYVAAATGAFLVAVGWNYGWNRAWTFRAGRGRVVAQGMRFLLVSVAAYGGNVGLLVVLVDLGVGAVAAQALAVVLVTPVGFLGNKLWTFRS